MSFRQAVVLRGQSILYHLRGLNNPVVAEVGVAFGSLSRFLLQHHPGLRLVMVDNWLPELERPRHYRATRDSNAHLTPEKAQTHRGWSMQVADDYAGRTIVLEGDSAKMAFKVDGESLDLCFVDADHSYEGVRRDLVAWYPKVRRGGWISGHDYANNDPRFDFSGVKRAVDEFTAEHGLEVELGENFTWFARK